MSRQEDVYRLEEILEEIKELTREAMRIIGQYPGTKERFRSYAYAHILGAIDKGHEFLGGSMITLDECIEEIKEGEEEVVS